MATIEERLTAAGADISELTGGESTNSAMSVNVGEVERWASAIGGGALALYGATRGSLGGIALALVGAALVHRGVSGHCNLYEAMSYSTAEGLRNSENVSVSGERGTKVEKSVTVNRPASELYAFWRNFENLPQFMNHLESVTAAGPNRTHWVVKAPAGTSVSWDAEVYNEKPGELIAWRTLEGSTVAHAGSVRFEESGGSTLVRVSLKYDPPGGKLGSYVASLFGENPEQQIEEDLGRFKQLMESMGTADAGDPSAGRGASAGV
ncbi:MAG TPA: SRPBCC family protein [Pyrinomonadaceae bacterium]